LNSCDQLWNSIEIILPLYMYHMKPTSIASVFWILIITIRIQIFEKWRPGSRSTFRNPQAGYKILNMYHTVCPRSSYPFFIVTYYIKWASTFNFFLFWLYYVLGDNFEINYKFCPFFMKRVYYENWTDFFGIKWKQKNTFPIVVVIRIRIMDPDCDLKNHNTGPITKKN